MGRDLELRYFRDTDGREVDFVVVERRQPLLLVECKWADAEPDRSLRYLKARFPAAEAWQLSATGRNDYVNPDGIRIAPALALLGRRSETGAVARAWRQHSQPTTIDERWYSVHI